MTKVIYRPDDGDPSDTKTLGYHFKANVPTDVPDSDPKLEIMRASRFFDVAGDAIQVKRPGRPKNPETSDEYRAFAVNWIQACDNKRELMDRWEREVPLRKKCGVGTDDYDYLDPFFTARKHQLRET